MLLGAEGVARLAAARVVVVGVGGVGAAAAEMLARAGVGHLVLIDSDTFSETNINRQLPALHSTIGESKVETVKNRLLDINPSLDIQTIESYLHEDSISEIFQSTLEKKQLSPDDLPLRSIPPTALRLWVPPSNVPEGGHGSRRRQPNEIAVMVLEKLKAER